MPHVADLSYRVVDLPCFCVAAARGVGTSPEMSAWSTLLEWAERRGLDPVSSSHRFFGFNDPSPSAPGEPYGYRQWMTVTPDVIADPHEDVTIEKFEGGTFVTTRCEGVGAITEHWRRLHEHATDAELEMASSPGLEELLTLTAPDPADYVFELYLPVVIR